MLMPTLTPLEPTKQGPTTTIRSTSCLVHIIVMYPSILTRNNWDTQLTIGTATHPNHTHRASRTPVMAMCAISLCLSM